MMSRQRTDTKKTRNKIRENNNGATGANRKGDMLRKKENIGWRGISQRKVKRREAKEQNPADNRDRSSQIRRERVVRGCGA